MSPAERWRYLLTKKSRHGKKPMLYVRVPGTPRMIRLHPPEGVRVEDYRDKPEWAPSLSLAYGQAVAELQAQRTGEKRGRGSGGSYDWLVGLYVASAEFLALDPGTQRRRKNLLEEFGDERPKGTPANPRPAPFGQQPVEKITRKLLRAKMGQWQLPRPDHPNPKARGGGIEAANNRLRAQRALWKWAMDAEHVEHNPARDVQLLESTSSGFHSWTSDEIDRYLRFYGPGTCQRVAIMVLLCTLTRRSDAWRLGNDMRRTIETTGPDGEPVTVDRVRFVPFKTRKPKKGKEPVAVEIPVLSVLDTSLHSGPSFDAEKNPDGVWIVGDRGRPFGSAAAFGNTFSGWCTKAGLPHCSAHGLRKAAARWLAELGLTPFQLNAVAGWTGMNMAQLYTEAADRRVQGQALAVLDAALERALARDRATVPEIADAEVVVADDGADE